MGFGSLFDGNPPDSINNISVFLFQTIQSDCRKSYKQSDTDKTPIISMAPRRQKPAWNLAEASRHASGELAVRMKSFRALTHGLSAQELPAARPWPITFVTKNKPPANSDREGHVSY